MIWKHVLSTAWYTFLLLVSLFLVGDGAMGFPVQFREHPEGSNAGMMSQDGDSSMRTRQKQRIPLL